MQIEIKPILNQEEVRKKAIRNKRPTMIQERAARIFVKALDSDEKINKSEIVKRAGGGIGLQHYPTKVFESQGFKKVTDELLGEINFDKESRLNILAEIANDRNISGEIKDKKNVISAIAEANKMTGDYAPIKQQNEDIITQRSILIKPE